jgi:hypothetical protein
VFSRLTVIGLGLLAVACNAASTPHDARPQSAVVNMQFARNAFYDAPFPSDDLAKGDGTIALDGFPNPDGIALVAMTKAMAASLHGFAEEGAVYFSLTGAPRAGSLPTMAASVAPGAGVFLVDVQPGSPDYLKPVPIAVRFAPDGGPFGAPNLLSLLPLQGAPMRASTRYAAFVTSATGLGAPPAMSAIAAGTAPAGMSARVFDEYQAALEAVAAGGVDPATIVGMTVFTTHDPTTQLAVVLKDALTHVPVPGPFHRTDVYDSYCVYESTLKMPDYQSGAAPYTYTCAADDPLCQKAGGSWIFDAAGRPVVQRYEEAGVVVTVPRGPMPAAGWPIAHFVRTGGGGNRPLVDRGPEAVNGGPPIVPGTGPALWFAQAGLAGASVDGPHEDLRNITGDNEDFLMFNIFNPAAMRDNIRESGVEYALFAHVLTSLSLDVGDCPGATSPARFDASHVALMGHSMGATIAPLAVAFEPLYRAVVVSGSGASWIENVVWKQQPLDIKAAISVLLGYTTARRELAEDDPVLTLFQWAEEPADSDVYSRGIVAEPPEGMEPRHWLMEQGIVDHYILPAIANAMSVSMGLDLVGKPLDATSAELMDAGDPTLESVLPFSTGKMISFPVSGNRASHGVKLTTMITQHPSDGVEDGHEIVFQTDAPKREYRCFLQTWAAGQTPVVPAPGDLTGPCQ